MRQATPLKSKSVIAEAWRRVELAALAGADKDGWSSRYKYSASRGKMHGKNFMLNFWRDQREDWQKTLELVFERAPTRRKRNSLFVSVPGRGVYVVHSGLVGGHGPHAGKRKFMKWYSACHGNSRFADVNGATYILVGRVGAPDLQRQVAEYVRDRQRFRAGEKPKPTRPPRPRRANSVLWKRRSPKVLVIEVGMPESVRVSRRHEVVVDRLGELLGKVWPGSVRVDRNGERDIYVQPKGRVTMLFEVKTDAKTTDIFTGVGQLMLHGAEGKTSPIRVLVLPRMPNPEKLSQMNRLGVSVLVYGWKSKVPFFRNWQEVIG